MNKMKNDCVDGVDVERNKDGVRKTSEVRYVYLIVMLSKCLACSFGSMNKSEK